MHVGSSQRRNGQHAMRCNPVGSSKSLTSSRRAFLSVSFCVEASCAFVCNQWLKVVSLDPCPLAFRAFRVLDGMLHPRWRLRGAGLGVLCRRVAC
jgi:hypothetical protein